MEIELTRALLDKIDQYIKGELEGPALLAFEQSLEKNPALKEEMMIQKRLFQTIGSSNLGPDSPSEKFDDEILEKTKSTEHQVLSDKIKKIGQGYIENPPAAKKSIQTRLRQIIPALAAIFLLVIISTVYLVNDSQDIDHYYHDNANWNTELISFAEKGDTKSAYEKAETFFNAKEYEKAIQSLEEIKKDDILYPYGLMYIGASNANLNQDPQALQAFNALALMTEFSESSKGLWYAALIHLKQKDKENAMKILNIIVKDAGNYHYQDAKQILKELE